MSVEIDKEDIRTVKETCHITPSNNRLIKCHVSTKLSTIRLRNLD